MKPIVEKCVAHIGSVILIFFLSGFGFVISNLKKKAPGSKLIAKHFSILFYFPDI